MVIVARAVRVSSWLPGFARCQWGSCEGADTHAPFDSREQMSFGGAVSLCGPKFLLKKIKNIN
jgi:hypothetical protein